MENGGNSEGGKSPAGKVKKVTLPKDPHAPKKPLTAYNLYAADQRVKMKKKNPDRSFGDMNREIGSLWNAMSQVKKKPYIDQAEEDRERYMREVEEYQRSDKYKKYLQTIAALQQRQQQKKDEKEKNKQQMNMPSPSKQPEKSSLLSGTNSVPLPPTSRPPPLSLKQSFVSGTEIPIFTNQFLLHNRELEVQVRKLRQATMDMEEENALLSRHVDNMRAQSSRLEGEIQGQILRNRTLKQRLVFLQESLTSAFGEVTIPGIDSVPTVDTIESYLKKVEALVARQPDDKHSDVVSMVRKVSMELVERVREREKAEEMQERTEEMDNL